MSSERNSKMAFGIVMVTVGAIGIVASTVLEIKTKAKLYEIMMKVFTLVFAIGCLFWKFS